MQTAYFEKRRFMGERVKQAIKLISEFEGFSEKPYLCPAGKWTIGFGMTRWNGKPVTANTKPITREQAEYKLGLELEAFQMGLDSAVTVPLNSNQNDALLSFIFNIGSSQFRKSTMLRLLNVFDYEGAAAQFPRWDKVKGKPMAGLTRRRLAEQKLFLTPVKG